MKLTWVIDILVDTEEGGGWRVVLKGADDVILAIYECDNLTDAIIMMGEQELGCDFGEVE